MSTNHHTPISIGAAANAATFNNPNGELDAAITTTNTDVAALDTRLDGVEALDGVTVSKIVGSDGSPDPAMSADANGNITVAAGQHMQADIFSTHRAPAVADDTAISKESPYNHFVFVIVINPGGHFLGVAQFGSIVTISNSGFDVVAGNGTLTGMDGPDGTINLRTNNKTLYVENRAGATKNIGISFLTGID